MAITAHPQTSTTTVPQVRSPERDRQRGRSRRALLGWGAVGAACLAVGALTVATLTGGDEAPPVPAHPGIVENGSPRAIDGSVEDVATVPAGPGLAEHGSPRANDGSVEDRFTAPSAEASGSNVADMPPVATRGVPASPQAETGAAAVTAEDEAPPATPSPLVSRKDPPL